MKKGSGLASMTLGAELEGSAGGKVRRGVEAWSDKRWSGKTRGVIGSIRGAGGCMGTADGLCFLEVHPTILIQCLRQNLHVQSLAMQVWPQPLTRHLPAPWAMGTDVANQGGGAVKVGWEESVGNMLGDFDDLQKKLQGSPFALEPQHCSD